MPTPRPPRFRTFAAQEQGVGGLLLLFVITQVLAVVVTLVQTRTILASFDPSVWNTIGLQVPSYRPIVIAEGIADILRVLLPVVGVVLIWRRSRRTIAFYSIFLLCLVLWGIADHMAAASVWDGVGAMLRRANKSSDHLRDLEDKAWNQTLRTIVYGGLWLFYWRTSARVRATFTPPITAPSPSPAPAGPE
jgi:hypothetical protein